MLPGEVGTEIPQTNECPVSLDGEISLCLQLSRLFWENMPDIFFVRQWYQVLLKMAGPWGNTTSSFDVFAEESQPIIYRVLFVSVWETQKPVIKCYKHLKFPIHDGLTSKRHSD